MRDARHPHQSIRELQSSIRSKDIKLGIRPRCIRSPHKVYLSKSRRDTGAPAAQCFPVRVLACLNAFTVYALLRLAFRIPEALAREALANRVDRNGFPLANLDAHPEVVHAWLENELACLD